MFQILILTQDNMRLTSTSLTKPFYAAFFASKRHHTSFQYDLSIPSLSLPSLFLILPVSILIIPWPILHSSNVSCLLNFHFTMLAFSLTTLAYNSRFLFLIYTVKNFSFFVAFSFDISMLLWATATFTSNK